MRADSACMCIEDMQIWSFENVYCVSYAMQELLISHTKRLWGCYLPPTAFL